MLLRDINSLRKEEGIIMMEQAKYAKLESWTRARLVGGRRG